MGITVPHIAPEGCVGSAGIGSPDGGHRDHPSPAGLHLDSSKTDLLGCFGAEAIRVESQRVLKVTVHPAHDVGAELRGRGSACLWSRGLVPSPLPSSCGGHPVG